MGAQHLERHADRRVKRSRVEGVLKAIAGLSAGAVALALLLQHGFGMQPCAWCTVQRLVFIAIAATAVTALALSRFGWLRRVMALLSVLLAAGGVWAALHQHFVAARTDSCGFTAADRFLLKSGLDDALPAVFAATASCSEANAPLLGIAFALWSASLFGVLCILSLIVLIARDRTSR